jgi:carbon storage regulator CsrA
MSNGYLVLTRKTDEALCFNITNSDGTSTEFKLSIDRIIGKQVRLSVDAPANVRVLREELIEAD